MRFHEPKPMGPNMDSRVVYIRRLNFAIETRNGSIYRTPTNTKNTIMFPVP